MRTTTYNDAIWNTSKNDPTVFLPKSATKLNEKASSGTYVEYMNVFGKKQTIPCRTKRQLKEAMEFLSMFKKEDATIKLICAQYNVKNGRFQNLYKLKQDLRNLGLTAKAINRITILK